MAASRLQRSVRVTLIGMVVNIILATGKIVAGIAGHSHALVADGVESLADLFSSVIVWRGLVVAAVPADEDHPYGHGKAEPIAAAMVATMLFVAAGWIAIHSVREIIRPHQAPAPFTLLVLLGVIVIKEFLFQFVLREGVSVESTAVRTDAWHHRSDAITSLAAAIGIGIALIGGPGYEEADDWAALVAAGVIVWNGNRLLRSALEELMDRLPDAKLVREISDIAARQEGVEEVEKCLVRKAGHLFFVDMHVQVDPEMTVQRSHEIAHAVKNSVRAARPAVRDVLVHIEPALKPSAATNKSECGGREQG